MPRMKHDAGDELARCMGVTFVTFAAEAKVEEIASRPWASITFTGARHLLTLRIEGADAGAAADDFLAGMEEREYALRGHLLADLALIEAGRAPGGRSVRLQLEALTVEEG